MQRGRHHCAVDLVARVDDIAHAKGFKKLIGTKGVEIPHLDSAEQPKKDAELPPEAPQS